MKVMLPICLRDDRQKEQTNELLGDLHLRHLQIQCGVFGSHLSLSLRSQAECNCSTRLMVASIRYNKDNHGGILFGSRPIQQTAREWVLWLWRPQ